MLYLLIPVSAFLLIAAACWAHLNPVQQERTWDGGIEDLDCVLAILMAAAWYKPLLVMRVGLSENWVKMTFPDSLVRMEVLLTGGQREAHKERYLEILRDLGHSPEIVSRRAGGEAVVCEIGGPSENASKTVRNALIVLFEVNSSETIEFRSFAHRLHQRAIGRALREVASQSDRNQTVVMSKGSREQYRGKAWLRCLVLTAQLLLLPIPFMIAYLQYGPIAASAILILIVMVFEIYRRCTKAKRGFGFRDVIKAVIVGLAAATIVRDTPLYLQLIPSIVLAGVATMLLVVMAFDLPPLFKFKDDEFPLPARRYLLFALVGTCIGGAALNEVLRATLTLDAWMWFFAFARIELILGFLVASIPAVAYLDDEDAEANSS